jgi:hypothetical protein
MEIVVTPHFLKRYLERKIFKEKRIEERVKDAQIVPAKIAKQLEIIHIPYRVIKEKKYFYAYSPEERDGLYCLQIKNGKIIVKTFYLIEGVIQERLKDLLEKEPEIQVKDLKI